jgi:hypothetical protein
MPMSGIDPSLLSDDRALHLGVGKNIQLPHQARLFGQLSLQCGGPHRLLVESVSLLVELVAVPDEVCLQLLQLVGHSARPHLHDPAVADQCEAVAQYPRF